VIVLFVVLAASLGNWLVNARIAKDSSAQARVIASYQQKYAADLAQLEQDRRAFDKRVGLPSTPAPAAAQAGRGRRTAASSRTG
jgi:hypothetical protein